MESPYRDLKALLAQAGADPALRQRITSMDAAMRELRRTSDAEESLSLWAVVQAYLWRFAAYVAAAAALGAWLAHRACAVRWRWAIPCGLLSALLVFALSWVVISPPWVPLAAPVHRGRAPGRVVGRVPQALLERSGAGAGRLGGGGDSGGRPQRQLVVRDGEPGRYKRSGGLAAPRGRNRNGAGVSRAGRGTSPRAARAFPDGSGP